jgi:hypothetical protein
MLSISTPPRLPDLRAGNDESYLQVDPAKQALPLGVCACSADSANNLPIGDLVCSRAKPDTIQPAKTECYSTVENRSIVQVPILLV